VRARIPGSRQRNEPRAVPPPAVPIRALLVTDLVNSTKLVATLVDARSAGQRLRLEPVW
jgi:hypothetical protein